MQVRAEQEFMEDPNLPLSHLQYALREFAITLPALHALVRRVVSGELAGRWGQAPSASRLGRWIPLLAIEAAQARACPPVLISVRVVVR